MDRIVADYLSDVRLGKLQVFKNMAIVPLFVSRNGGPEYGLLKEALDEALIAITEVDQSGSVPELKVVNTSPRPVLLLDGEELIGAKQNRVLNTSILLKGNSETVVPVSCTEQGRWRYTSATLSDSDTIMSHRSRVTKTLTVTGSLRIGRGYESDQGRVWSAINSLHAASGTTSRTLALRDVYTDKTEELEPYSSAFERVPHQRGSLVLINGQPVGLDLLSREGAYAAAHPKLVKSYAIDALVGCKERFDAPSLEMASAFLDEIRDCEESVFPSVGLGYDHRFQGDQVVGSGLVFEESVIHLAFFRFDKRERFDNRTSYLERRDLMRG
jgi:hypothetical protein